jgi:O-antigen/teichoic acid export membrane protein
MTAAVGTSRTVVKNASYNAISQALVAVVAIVLIPRVVAALGVDSYGLLAVAIALMGSISLLELGLGRATTKFVAQAFGAGEIEGIGAIVWMSLRVQLLLGAAGAILLAAATPVLTSRVLKIAPTMIPDAQRMFYLLAIGTPVILLMSTLRGALEGAQRFDVVNVVKTAVNLSTYVVPIAGASAHARVSTIVAVLVVVRVLGMIAYFAFCRWLIPSFHVYRAASPAGLFALAGWVAVSNVAMPLLSQVDRYMIATVIGVASVTFFAVPFEIVNGLWLVPASLSAALFPVFSSYPQDSVRLETMMSRSIKFILLTVGPAAVLLAVFSYDVLLLWQRQAIAERSHVVLSILAIAVLINSVGWIPTGLLIATGRAHSVAQLHLAQLLLYGFICYGFTHAAGVVGAAAAFGLRVTCESIVLLALVRHSVKSLRRVANELINPFLVVAVFAAALAGTRALHLSPAAKVAVAGGLWILTGVASWYFALTAVDREFFVHTFLVAPIRRRTGGDIAAR